MEISNLAGLSKPVNTLIKRISNAVGIVYEPYRIRQKSKAEAYAKLIAAKTDIEVKYLQRSALGRPASEDAKKQENIGNVVDRAIPLIEDTVQPEIEVTDLQRRAIDRWAAEEAKKQENIENVMDQTIPLIEDTAQPEKVDDDWFANYFDKVKTVSNEDVQKHWADLLAKEVNQPGSFSKRTVNTLHTMDRKDAELFESLCRYVWVVREFTPIILDESDEIYSRNGINLISIQHLEMIGLIHFVEDGFVRKGITGRITVSYCGKNLHLNFGGGRTDRLNVGKVLFTQIGKELFTLTNPSGIDDMYDYVSAKWNN